jgi:predicted amidohydrolase
MRVAAVQLESSVDIERNLATAERLVRGAAADGAELVVLPERLDIRGAAGDYLRGAQPLDGRPVSWARELARELGIDLVAGSVSERREGRERVGNTSVHVGPDGEVKAVYRKIHMFDVVVGDVEYRESDSSEAADEIVVSETANGVGLGLSVCYDLRFPELYRILALRGARIVTVPANFTRITGEAHWEILLRARAIENQVFVIAPGQGNRPGPEGDSYGNSMIVDPWGEVLARGPAKGAVAITAELDLARQDEIREKLPSLANRVEAAYRWPAAAALAAGGRGAALAAGGRREETSR